MNQRTPEQWEADLPRAYVTLLEQQGFKRPFAPQQDVIFSFLGMHEKVPKPCVLCKTEKPVGMKCPNKDCPASAFVVSVGRNDFIFDPERRSAFGAVNIRACAQFDFLHLPPGYKEMTDDERSSLINKVTHFEIGWSSWGSKTVGDAELFVSMLEAALFVERELHQFIGQDMKEDIHFNLLYT